MKKEYMKPATLVVELQHKTHLLLVSETKSLTTSGLDQEDDIDISQQGGGSSIWDR